METLDKRGVPPSMDLLGQHDINPENGEADTDPMFAQFDEKVSNSKWAPNRLCVVTELLRGL